MHNMKFSIILTTYNQLEMLKKHLSYWDAQTFKDFEAVLADDGSSDGTKEWFQNESRPYPIKYVWQEDDGYQFTKIVNKAAKECEGEYLIFAPADCYPKEDYLERMSKSVEPHKLINGVRENVTSDGEFISIDWRLTQAPGILQLFMQEGVTQFPVHSYPYPWVLMTTTAMAINKADFEAVGGLTQIYDKGYGKMDWSLAMKCFYSGCILMWNTEAVLYHVDHPGQEDTENNTQAFLKELKEWQSKGAQ